MARKSLRDMSGIAGTIARSGASAVERTAKTSAPALGALQGSLASIRELDPALVDDWGPVDRMNEFTAVNEEDSGESFDALVDSIRDGGQQVPILVRRSAAIEGRYEAIYGRRRLKACRDLGIKVRANIQDIDDAAALLAKGLENAARRNLSFYEKARFAEAIQAAGHDTGTVRQVLNLSAPGHSHLNKVTQNVPSAVGDMIGPAPKSGRPRWTELADLFAARKITEKSAIDLLSGLDSSLTSDQRLEAVIKEAAKRGAKITGGSIETVPFDGAVIKSGRSTLTLSVKKAGANSEFAVWLEDHLDEIIRRSYAEFTSKNSGNGN